jgi:multiple sugar transport system permease protein
MCWQFAEAIPCYFLGPVSVNSITPRHGTAYNLSMAGSTVATIPILILFIFLQRYFIRGVVLSGLKG